MGFSVHHIKVHDYLGIDLDFSNNGVVKNIYDQACHQAHQSELQCHCSKVHDIFLIIDLFFPSIVWEIHVR